MQSRNTISEFRAFEATPGSSVIILPDSPTYTVVAVSNDFIALTGLRRNEIIGQSHFQFFSRGNNGSDFGSEKKLRSSFDYVIENKAPHEIPLQRFDIPTSDGHFVLKYWRVKNVPVLDEESGEVLYMIHTAVDITDRVIAEDKVESVKDVEKAYKFFTQAPVIVGFVRGDDYVIDFANQGLLKVWKATTEVIGKGLFTAFPELKEQGFKNLLDEVRRSGKAFFGYEHPITFDQDGRTETYYFDFIYQPFYDDDSSISKGIISVGYDVTDRVKAKQKFKNVVEQAHDSILILKGENMVLEAANDATFKSWKVDQSAIGKPFLEILPEMKGQGFFEIFQKVYRTGEAIQGFETPAVFLEKNGERRTVYFNCTYQPYREANGEISGVIVLSSDATAQVLAKAQMEETERRWKELANAMPVIVWTSDPEGRIDFFNKRWCDFTGLSVEESVGTGWTKVLHPEDLEVCRQAWNKALDTNSEYECEVRYRSKEGEYRWVISRGIPIKQEDKIIAWYGTSTDFHDQKQLAFDLEEKVIERTKEIEQKSILINNILKHSSNGISVSKVFYDDEGNLCDALTILANDSAVHYIGLPKELYFTKKSYVLRAGYCKLAVRPGV